MDYGFLLECVNYAQMRYEETSGKYMKIPSYYQTEYRPKMEEFAKAKKDLREVIKNEPTQTS